VTDQERLDLIDKLRAQVEFLIAGAELQLPARDRVSFSDLVPPQAGGPPA